MIAAWIGDTVSLVGTCIPDDSCIVDVTLRKHRILYGETCINLVDTVLSGHPLLSRQ